MTMKRCAAALIFGLFLTIKVFAQDATNSGSLTAMDQAVTLDLDNFGVVAVQITGTWVGTLAFEATVDGSAWFAVNGYAVSTYASATTATANGQYFIPVAGFRTARARASAYTSGTMAVTLRATGQAPVIPATGGAGLTDAQLRAAAVPVSGNWLTDAQLRALAVPVSGSVGISGSVAVTGTFFQATQPISGTVTANQGTANTVANSWPTLVTDGTDTAIVVGDSANEPSAKGLMIAGYSRDSNLAYPFPLLQQNYTVATGNTLAVPVDMRTTAALNGGTNPRSNMILVGGRSNSSSVFGSQLVFGNGETLIDNPANTYALQVRELGQSYSNNGSISALNQRFTVSNRYVNWSAGVITLTNSSFVGTLKPVVSTDNGTTWDFVSAINTVTGEFTPSLVNSAAAGTFVIPAAAGSTNYGFQISAYTSGSVQPRVSANNGINSIYTAGVIVNATTSPVPTKALRAATPTVSSVAGSATSVTCLAANANRLGASIFNDSSAALYIKLGATASITSFTTKLVTDEYFEIPFNYTGVIDCIWSLATGNARVTEAAQ